jgi:2-haloacid dehalogenase
MAVRALVFDVFGTLVDWRSGVAEAFRASAVAGDPAELADAWRERYRPILAEVNEGARPWGNSAC